MLNLFSRLKDFALGIVVAVGILAIGVVGVYAYTSDFNYSDLETLTVTTLTATTADITTANIDTLAVTVASSVIGHTDAETTSNTTSTISVIQGGSGDVLSLFSAGSEIFSVLSNGNIVLESGDTIKNDTASTTVLSRNVGIGSSTPQAVLSVSSPIQSSTD